MSLSAPDLAKIRAEKQHTRLYLAVLQPATIFEAQINQSFSSNDMVTEFLYDNVTTGAYGDIEPGMTVYIGTTTGAYDVGLCRARKDADATTIYVGETSEIDFVDDLYITVVDEFTLWPRHLQIGSNEEAFMDVDVDYSDQHTDFDPVPILGSHVVKWLTGASVDVSMNAGDSYVYGSSISSYAWSTSAASGLSFDNDAIAAPTLTITAAGTYRVTCEVTAANGKSFKGHRYIFVYDSNNMPVDEFELGSLNAEVEAGGWEFEVAMHDSTDQAKPRFRSLCILFARDWYDGVEGSVGLDEGWENIVSVGYVAEIEDFDDPEHSPKAFRVRGAHWWFSQMTAFPSGVEMDASPSAWTSMSGLTTDRGLWHFLHWRTTATAVMDVLLTGDTKYASAIEAGANSLWAQIFEMAENTLLARPIVDKYGRLHVKVPYNLIPEADRAAASEEVMSTLTSQDFQREVEVEHATPLTGQVSLSGVYVEATGNGHALFSLAPGHTPALVGDIKIIDRLLLGSQTQANTLAGLIFERDNNEFPNIPIELTGNNRAFDIAPILYTAITLDDYSGTILPHAIEMDYDKDSGFLEIRVTFHAATTEGLNIDGDIPTGPDTSLSLPPLPKLPKLPPLPPVEPFYPGGVGDENSGPKYVLLNTTNFGFIYSKDFNTSSPTWNFMNSGLSSDEKNRVNRVLVTPSGAFFAMTHDGSAGTYGLKVWWADGLGGPWSLLKDTTGLSGTNPFLGGLGYDPDSNERIAIATGTSFALESLGTFWLGDRSGVSQTASAIDSQGRYGDIEFLDGWLWIHAESNAFSSQAYSKFNSAGGIVTNTANFGSGSTYDASRHHSVRGGSNVYHWNVNSSYMRTIENFDAAGSTTAANGWGSLGAGNLPDMICSGPSGQYLMGSDGSVVGQRSSDYGATWGNVGGGLSIGYSNWENCASQVSFLTATTQVVQYTSDFGDNWTDKSGNLATIAPLCAVRHLLFVSW